MIVKKKWRQKLKSWVMLSALLVPFMTMTSWSVLNLSSEFTQPVLAKSTRGSSSSHGHGGNSGGNNSSDHKKDDDDNKKDKKKSSSSSASNKGQSSDTAQGNILDQPANDLASDASKQMTSATWDPDKKSNDEEVEASLKTVSPGDDGHYNIGNAWSFMASSNAFWSLSNQGDSSFNVGSSSGDNDNLKRFPTAQGKTWYHAMVNAVHLPYIMYQLGLDKSFSQGFGKQKHDQLEMLCANIEIVCYNGSKMVNNLFSYVLDTLNDYNPFDLILGNVNKDSEHFGPVANLLRDVYDSSANFGKMIMVVIFGLGIGLAAMGIQVGQQSHVSQARGMVASGLDLFKRSFVVLVLCGALAICYGDLLKFTNGLFQNAGYAPGNYAVYSTMTNFESFVTHGRLNFSRPLLDDGLLPTQGDSITASRVKNAYLNHRAAIRVNADYGMPGAQKLMQDTSGVNYDATANMFKDFQGDDNAVSSSLDMLKDFTSNRTYNAASFVSDITPGIMSKPKDNDAGGGKKKTDSTAIDGKKSDLSDLKSYAYSANGALTSTASGDGVGQFWIDKSVQGNSTQSSSHALAVRRGGLSTIGMYNYLRTVVNGNSVMESSPYKHNNAVSDPQHFSVNYVGSGSLTYANILFATCVMVTMMGIAVGTLWFVIKSFIDAIPNSISGVIQGALGSLAGGARAIGTLVGFFISITVSGLMYQLSFKVLVAFIGSFESYFGTNNVRANGGVMSTIKLLGFLPQGSDPVRVAGAITLTSGMFTVVTLIESGLMIYILTLFFKWRASIIQALTTASNSVFERIMQSFGALSGRGSTGMPDGMMANQAKQASQAGIGNMYNKGKNFARGAGALMGMGSRGKGSAGKLAAGLAGVGAAGIGSGMAMKGLSNLIKDSAKNNSDKSLKHTQNNNHHSKNSDKAHSNDPKNAEDARQQAMLSQLQAQQGDPLAAMNTGMVGDHSMKADQDAQKAASQPQDALQNMESMYGDQGHLEQLADQRGNAQGNASGKAGKSPSNKSLQNQSAIGGNASNPQQALNQVLAQAGGHDPMSALAKSQQMPGTRQHPLSKAQRQQLAKKLGVKPQQITSDGQVMDVNGQPLDLVDQTVGDPLTDTAAMADAEENTQYGIPSLDTSDVATEQNADPMAMTDDPSAMTNVSGLDTPTANKVAKQISKATGGKVTGQDVQQLAPMMDNTMSSIDNTLSGGTSGDLAPGTTISQTTDGQTVISSPSINGQVAYGKGQGVMPGNVPLGMSTNPAYTSSGAGVIHGGLGSALGHVQNTSAQVIQTSNAVKANPNNPILQQRATQALQSQQAAQVGAMRMYNQTPANQTVGSLINSGTPQNISTGQVNQAVSHVYEQQQAFKRAVQRFGADAPQAQQAAQNYQQALNHAHTMHVKSQILKQPKYLHAAYQQVRKQQMSIMDGSFKL